MESAFNTSVESIGDRDCKIQRVSALKGYVHEHGGDIYRGSQFYGLILSGCLSSQKVNGLNLSGDGEGGIVAGGSGFSPPS